MRNPIHWLAGTLAMLLIAAPAWSAPPRFDATSKESIARSVQKIRQSLTPDEFESFRASYMLVMADAVCPSDVDRPNLDAMFQRDARSRAAIHGKTADDIIAAATVIQSAVLAERAAMPLQAPDSPLGKAITADVRKYLDEVPAGAENFSSMFPFWTRARVEYAVALKPIQMFEYPPGFKAPAQHDRDMFLMRLHEDDWLKYLTIDKILASPTKAYVFLAGNGKTARTTFLLDDGKWKAHSDLFGYPWSRENSAVVECVEH